MVAMGMLVFNPLSNTEPMPMLGKIKGVHMTDFEYCEDRLVPKQCARSFKKKSENIAFKGRKKSSVATRSMPSLDSSTLTPSLSSVLCQIKKRDGERRNTGSTMTSCGSLRSSASSQYETTSEENTSDFDLSFDGVLGADANMVHEMDSNPSHPLSSSVSSAEADRTSDGEQYTKSLVQDLPYTKYINLQDLDLFDFFSPEDIVQPIKPIYERPKTPIGINSILNSNPNENVSSSGSKKKLNPIIFEERVVEMEHWPTSQQTNNLQPACLPNTTAQKRTRQQSLNPSFLRLYALETSMKKKNVLPDLNLDESILQKLSYQEICQLKIPLDPSNKITPDQIKLALITRKKLWSDMCHITRTDLHGEYSPCNLRFVKLA